jgi:hypothetical protein
VCVANRDRGRLRQVIPAHFGAAFGETKVENLHDTIRRDLDVRRLQIAMDDAFVVSGLEGVGDLPRHRERIGNRDRATAQTVRQGLTFDEFEHQGSDPFALFEAVDRADVRVIERREHTRFALESRESLGVGGECARQHLDGHVAPEARVARSIHLSHSAPAEKHLHVIDTETTAYPLRGVNIVDHPRGNGDSLSPKERRDRRLLQK